MKAFQVTDEWGDGHAVVVFAETAGKAKAEGAGHFDRAFLEVSCKRMPQYDQYAAAGYVPKAVLLADGWWFTCDARCSKNASGEAAVVDGNRVFCSETCSESAKVPPTERLLAEAGS